MMEIPNVYRLTLYILLGLICLNESTAQETSMVSRLMGTFSKLVTSLSPLLDEALDGANVSQTCRIVMTDFVQQVARGNQWALKMLDASGKPGQGLMKGHIHWMGDYDECVEISKNQSDASIPAIEESGFWFHGGSHGDSKYCVASILIPENLSDIEPALTVGSLKPTLQSDLCLPRGCSDTELFHLFNSSVASIGLDLETISCVEPDTDLLQDRAVTISIVVLSIIALLTITGTILDVYYQFYPPRGLKRALHVLPLEQIGNPNGVDHQTSQTVSNGDANVSTIEDYRNTSSKRRRKLLMMQKTNSEDKTEVNPISLPVRLLMAFSLRSNVIRLLDTRQATGSLGCLNGIRVLSMAWVILGHTYSVSLGLLNVENLKESGEIIHSIFAQAIINGTLSVDTFFLLSGLLVTYLFCRDYEKSARKLSGKKMAFFYFHRFWRLTPFYMLILMIYTSFFPHMRNGPLWPKDFPDADSCRETWWHNIIYVNNILIDRSHCMGVTWYLANDMQFYILAPFVLIPLLKRPVLGWNLLILLVFTHVLSTAALVVHVEGTMLNSKLYNIEVYVKPYCRVGVYAIGIGLGWLLFRRKTVRISKILNVFGWMLSITVMLILNYVTYTEHRTGGYKWSIAAAAAFEGAYRVGWALAVSWVIFACCKGYGGVINTVLSWSVWIPLTRLTYAAYLLHPIVILTYEFSRRQLFHYSMYNMVYLFLSHIFMTYLVAFAFSATLEAPLFSLERIMRGGKR